MKRVMFAWWIAPFLSLSCHSAMAVQEKNGFHEYMVQFYEAGIMDYDGSLEGLAKTASDKLNAPPDFGSKEVELYEKWLDMERSRYLEEMSTVLSRTLKVTHTYTVIQHAIALPLAEEEVPHLKRLPFVRAIWLPEPQYPATYSIAHFVGSDFLDIFWRSARSTVLGRGVTIGVIDTGGNNIHQSFQAMGSECGYAVPTPKIVLKNCNRDGCPIGNEPGANCLDNPMGSANDCAGHGTHVAGIAAGNATLGTSTFNHLTRMYRGIAGCASLISYNASPDGGLEPTLSVPAILQAVEQAMRDRVQIINMSFGPRTGASYPWLPITNPQLSPLITLRLIQAGILPVSAAGNLQPSYMPEPVAGEIEHTAPWELVVAAATANDATLGSFPPPLPRLAPLQEHMGNIGANRTNQIAYFSLLGPARNAPGVTKPDLVAPGVNIESASTAGPTNTFVAQSGTSVAAPIVAGGAALIKSINPSWSPSEIQSALMLTADTVGEVQDRSFPAPWPWRQWKPDEGGAGRVAIDRAGFAGFVLNETYEHFLNADPARGGDPTTLNLAYVRGMHCVATCGWQRILRATHAEHITWHAYAEMDDGIRITVSPSVFTLSSIESSQDTVRLSISAERTTSVTGRTLNGTIWFVPELVSLPTGGTVPTAHMAVTIEDN